MARPKEFDRETVLKEAIKIFAAHGYEGSSTDVLLQAMGISRQSLYDTFGDKKGLYLEALQFYSGDSVANLIRTMNRAPSPLQGLEAALMTFASRPAADAPPACMGVGAICEFGRSDQDVTMLTETASRTLRAALESLLTEAKAAGEIGSAVDIRTAAEFFATMFSGMKISARAGTAPEALRRVAQTALLSVK